MYYFLSTPRTINRNLKQTFVKYSSDNNRGVSGGKKYKIMHHKINNIKRLYSNLLYRRISSVFRGFVTF